MRAIAIVDDHAVLSQALALFLESSLKDTHVFGFSSIIEMHKSALSYDLVLLDLHQPDVAAARSLNDLINELKPAHTAIISGDETPSAVRRACAAGAVGFLLKSMSHTKMRIAVELLLEGSTFFEGLNNEKNTTDFNFSEREKIVVDFLAEGYSNKKIALEIGTTEGAVKQILRSVFRKMAVSTRSEAVSKIIRHGKDY